MRLTSRVLDIAKALRDAGFVCCLAMQSRAAPGGVYARRDRVRQRNLTTCFSPARLRLKKPDTRFYEAVEAALGLRGEQIAFWDDRRLMWTPRKSAAGRPNCFTPITKSFERQGTLETEDDDLTGWRKQPIGDLPLYQAKTMAWLPRISQGFTTGAAG